MTLTDLIPALKGPGRRRAVDKVEELRRNEITILTNLHAAGDEIALLRQDLDQEKTLRGEAEEAAARMRMERDAVIEERDGLRDEVLMFRARFGAQLAAEANAAAITVPPMVRDTSAIEDQATGPIDVRSLQEAVAAGPIGPVMDPGHVASREFVRPPAA